MMEFSSADATCETIVKLPLSPYGPSTMVRTDFEPVRLVVEYRLKPNHRKRAVFQSVAEKKAFLHRLWRLGELKDSPEPHMFGKLIEVYLVSANTRWHGVVRKHVASAFGDLRLADVTVEHLVQFRDELIGAQSSDTAVVVMNRLKDIFNEAWVQGWIEAPDNPMPKLPKPRQTEMPRVSTRRRQSEILPLPSLEVIARIVAQAEGWLLTFFLLAIFAGLRSQEIRALRFRHIEIFDDYARINVSWAIKNRSIEEGPLKTASGRRHVDLSGLLFVHLKWLFGKNPKPSDLLVSDKSGGVMRYDDLWQAVHDFQISIGIGSVTGTGATRRIVGSFAPHVFRHAAAALWIWAGMDDEKIMRQLGHGFDEIRTSLDVYGYLFAAQMANPYEWPVGDVPVSIGPDELAELEMVA